MNILHTGLVSTTEKNADKFYQDLLGLSKQEPRELQADFINKIFGIQEEMKMIHYLGEHADFEIFIYEKKKETPQTVEHTCIEVKDREDFLSRAESAGLSVNRVDTGQKTLVFVRDFDGHLFEVKEIASP